jgi:CheY-like chemotaxis protein
MLQAVFENGSPRRQIETANRLAGKKILLADDDTYSRLVVKAHLERCGAHTAEAGHGEAVLQWLDENPTIDAILMDLNMPGMGGTETARAIRARADAYRDIPILALTGHSDIETIQAGLDAGMNDVMTKPVQTDVLYAKLARQFGAMAPEQGHAAQSQPQPDTRIVKAAIPTENHLLDESRLEGLKALDLMDDAFPNYIEQIGLVVAQLNSSVASRDAEEMQRTLHLLLGISGNIGASALHQFTRQIYPPVAQGAWPNEAGWLERINMLSGRSVEALRIYYAAANRAVHN